MVHIGCGDIYSGPQPFCGVKMADEDTWIGIGYASEMALSSDFVCKLCMIIWGEMVTHMYYQAEHAKEE